MKAKSRKNRLVHVYARSLKERQPAAVDKRSPFSIAINDLLFKKIDPLPEITDDTFEVVTEKRPRGRPRKTKNEIDGKYTHKIEFDKSEFSIGVDHADIGKMIHDFRFHYKVNDIPLVKSLERICAAYHISYVQAHNLLKQEF